MGSADNVRNFDSIIVINNCILFTVNAQELTKKIRPSLSAAKVCNSLWFMSSFNDTVTIAQVM